MTEKCSFLDATNRRRGAGRCGRAATALRMVGIVLTSAGVFAESANAQPAPARVVAAGDSVRVYEPLRLEGSVISVAPESLVLRSEAAGTITLSADSLRRLEVYTGFVPRRGRIIEGTLIGMGTGMIPMLTLIGKCSDSCAFTGIALLGVGGGVLGGLIGGTTAGPQWRRARLPPVGGQETVRPSDAADGGGSGVRLTLLRIPL